jgi:hypothetical protein
MLGKEIRRSRGKGYSTEQMIGFLRAAEVLLSQGLKLGDVCRKLGISEQSYDRWRKMYGGLKMDQARQFKELEREHFRLKKAVSELTLDKMILNEALSGKSFALERFFAFNIAKTVWSMSDLALRVSERRACRVIGQHRSTQRCQKRGRDDVEREKRSRSHGGRRRVGQDVGSLRLSADLGFALSAGLAGESWSCGAHLAT